MYERIIEIIVFLISEFKQNKSIGDIDLDELMRRGYTSAEITTAFSWLAERFELSEQLFFHNKAARESSFRILHQAEQELFTKESWGELLQLQALGLVSNEHIEQIIEKSLMVGMRKIDSRQLKSFVANMIFYPQHEQQYGSRIMLNGSDLIN